jgi:hypothetical protein
MKTDKFKSRKIAMISLFAGISIILDSKITPGFSSGVWFGWIFLISPISGIFLGPKNGFIATLISVLIGHTLVIRDTVYEYIFTLGAPIASLISGLMFRGKWNKVFILYTFLLLSYIFSPLFSVLPIWGMWDCYLAYMTLLFLGIGNKLRIFNYVDYLRTRIMFATFIGLEADILYRIFILVPCNAYIYFYGFTPEVLAMIWSMSAPLITPIKVALSILLSIFIVPSIYDIIRQQKIYDMDD